MSNFFTNGEDVNAKGNWFNFFSFPIREIKNQTKKKWVDPS